jgi:methionyl-tRNA formyltransferase
MKISILVTSKEHPVIPYITRWAEENNNKNQVNIIYRAKDLIVGDILFLISCSDIVLKKDREKFEKVLVIHASDLPKGRGWSPHIWEIIRGANEITLSLFEAKDRADSGDIWKKVKICIPEIALYDEINDLVFGAEIGLMDFAVSNFHCIRVEKQSENSASYFPKRMPDDSEIDINKSLAEQFNLIRVCDINRFPAFFYKNGQKFLIKVEKDNG